MIANAGRSYKRSVCRSEKPEADGSTPSRPILPCWTNWISCRPLKAEIAGSSPAHGIK